MNRREFVLSLAGTAGIVVFGSLHGKPLWFRIPDFYGHPADIETGPWHDRLLRDNEVVVEWFSGKGTEYPLHGEIKFRDDERTYQLLVHDRIVSRFPRFEETRA